MLAALPAHSLVLVDGLLVDAHRESLVSAATRLRLVVLLHMPDAHGAPAREPTVLGVAAAVIATSRWTRRLLTGRHDLDQGLVHVAEPGVVAAPPAPGTPAGGSLLCVAAVTPGKGHDVLLDALSDVRDRDWRCVCVGSLNRDPAWAAHVGRRVRELGLEDRVSLAGARTDAALAASYAGADALVLATRGESYGMVVVEALARGLPVIASDVGGVPEAIGHTRDGRRPGLLVPAGDSSALGDAVRRWLDDEGLRRDLRDAARLRRGALPGWEHTVDRVEAVLARVLEGVAA